MQNLNKSTKTNKNSGHNKNSKNNMGFLKAIWTLTKYMLKFYKWSLIAFWLIDILISIVVLVETSVSSKILDQIVYILNTPNVDMFKIVKLILTSTLLGIMYVGLLQWKSYLDSVMALKREIFHDIVVGKKMMLLHPSTYDDLEFVELKTRVGWNLWKAFSTVYSFSSVLSNMVSAFIYGFIVLKFSVVAFALVFISIIPYYFIASKFGDAVWSIWSDEGEDKIKYSSYIGPIYTVSQALIVELKVFNQWKYLLKKAININKKFVKKFSKQESLRFFYNFLENVFEHVLSALSVYVIVVKVISQHLGVGIFYLVYTMLQRTKDSIYGVIYNMAQLSTNKGIIIDTYRLMTYKSKLKDGTKRLKKNSKLTIEFKHVWFKYPRGKDWVLKDINLKINYKDKIAIVGKNGAGKSTLLKLMLRVYDPTKGEILVNGVNLKDIKLDDYYQFFGFLTQSVHVPNIKIKENIYLGDTSSKLNKDKMIKSAQIADIKDKIEALPKKYDTYLNREIKGGVELSGGEVQKLGIARVFYRDPQIIILDEPTSAIDAIAEKRIFDNLFENFKDKTIIIVSHRFSTITTAKYIYVIDNGKIVEKGSHKELIKAKGLYAKMYNAQRGK